MNNTRWKILSIIPAVYVVIVGLTLLYHVVHRGYPPKSFGDCVALAFMSGLKFFATKTGILILIGLFMWFCSSPTRNSESR